MDELMLAMDVVDTLRHQELLVERELNAEQRDARLLDRLREIYTSQGIDVPDRVLLEGIGALKEERFTYRPPTSNLSVRLAHVYVTRDRWLKPLLAAVAAIALLVAVYFAIARVATNRRLDALSDRLSEQREAITQLSATGAPGEAADGLLQEGEAALAQRDESGAREAVQGLESLRSHLEVEAQEQRQLASLSDRLAEERQAVERLADAPEVRAKAAQFAQSAEAALARSDAAGASAAVEGLTALRTNLEATQDAKRRLESLRERLTKQRQDIERLTESPAAAERATRLGADGEAAVRRGDVSAAAAAANALDELRERLAREYEVRIVSRPNELTGVIRSPDLNPSAENHYIVVEAVAPDGRVLSLPITSEEDGRTRTVSRWALRVEKAVYDRVAADKKDDGVVQNGVFGLKRRGQLDPDYNMPTSGAAITAW